MMNRQEESDRFLSADWRIHFPAKLAESPDLQERMILTLREVLPPEALPLLPRSIFLGVTPLAEDEEELVPALWLSYGERHALLAHETFADYRSLLLRTWWQLTGITEVVLWGADGKWAAQFDPAPGGRYVLYTLGGEK